EAKIDTSDEHERLLKAMEQEVEFMHRYFGDDEIKALSAGETSGGLTGSPDGKPHLTLASWTGVDANSCVSCCRKFVDACDFHLFAALTYGQFGTARYQQALKDGHKSPFCVG